MNNIFVGNLSFEATREDLIKLFEPFGSVADVLIMLGKKGNSRGFGFVDMPNEEEKNAAIAALEGKEFMWRVLTVSSVMPKAKSEVSQEGIPKETGKSKKNPKPSREKEQISGGSPKPWRKVKSSPKSSRKKDEGSRPYYGKSNKPVTSKGFKMSHKVSGAPRASLQKQETLAVKGPIEA